MPRLPGHGVVPAFKPRVEPRQPRVRPTGIYSIYYRHHGIASKPNFTATETTGSPGSAARLNGAPEPPKSAFEPRTSFQVSDSIPRSYFLGHHLKSLRGIASRLASTDLFVECRDYRLPLTSVSPLLEQAVRGKPRIIVYTHRDLVDKDCTGRLTSIRPPGTTVMVSGGSARDADRIIDGIRAVARERDALTGLTAMVIGMPNTGKSTLLNRLRLAGLGQATEGLAGRTTRVARTGDHPGVTRSFSTPVRVLGDRGRPDEAVYMVDAPGVFYPYVADPVDMVKLALTKSVKPGLVPDAILADYLLFRLNLVDPSLYAAWGHPTNDIAELLDRVARRTGRLARGGRTQADAAATFLVERWRRGGLGRFLLDDTGPEAVTAKMREWESPPESASQIRARGRKGHRPNDALLGRGGPRNSPGQSEGRSAE